MDQSFPAPSVQIVTAFSAWRAAHLALCASPSEDDAVLDIASDERGRQFRQLVTTPAANATDFAVKAYVGLLHQCGYPTCEASLFDIDTSEFDGNGMNDDAHMWGTYADFERTDVGRCLLAFGLLEFDAAAWVVAADDASLGVWLHAKAPGGPTLAIEASCPADDCERMQHVRLRRLIATGGRDRTRLVLEHIESRRPDLIVGASTQQVMA